MNDGQQTPRLFVMVQGISPFRKGQRSPPSTRAHTIEGCGQHLLPLLLEGEEQRQVGTAAAALRRLLDLGPANGTTHG